VGWRGLESIKAALPGHPKPVHCDFEDSTRVYQAALPGRPMRVHCDFEDSRRVYQTALPGHPKPVHCDFQDSTIVYQIGLSGPPKLTPWLPVPSGGPSRDQHIPAERGDAGENQRDTKADLSHPDTIQHLCVLMFVFSLFLPRCVSSIM
jgi:hypothetical protein